jgi:protein Tex
VAIGNGTASRETEAAVRAVLADVGAVEPPAVVLVNEAGASVYSASDVAREELPGIWTSPSGAPFRSRAGSRIPWPSW